jgi:hypothetical protein
VASVFPLHNTSIDPASKIMERRVSGGFSIFLLGVYDRKPFYQNRIYCQSSLAFVEKMESGLILGFLPVQYEFWNE